MNTNLIRREVERVTKEASFNLREDVLKCIRKAYKNERNRKAKLALGWIIENADIAKKERIAICQDTGFPMVFIEAGLDSGFLGRTVRAVTEAVEEAYKKNYLRASLVNPLQRKKPGYGPVLTHVEFNNKLKGLKITVFPKGFGSENKSRLKMFNPTADWRKIEDFILDAVKKAGPEACPPYIIGVGIGGSCDYSLLLAKKALIDKIDEPNADKSLSRLEDRLLKKVNALRIGPMGLGGSTTALAVKIRTHPTHIAGYPVGVNISCWALRSATVKIPDARF